MKNALPAYVAKPTFIELCLASIPLFVKAHYHGFSSTAGKYYLTYISTGCTDRYNDRLILRWFLFWLLPKAPRHFKAYLYIFLWRQLISALIYDWPLTLHACRIWHMRIGAWEQSRQWQIFWFDFQALRQACYRLRYDYLYWFLRLLLYFFDRRISWHITMSFRYTSHISLNLSLASCCYAIACLRHRAGRLSRFLIFSKMLTFISHGGAHSVRSSKMSASRPPQRAYYMPMSRLRR